MLEPSGANSCFKGRPPFRLEAKMTGRFASPESVPIYVKGKVLTLIICKLHDYMQNVQNQCSKNSFLVNHSKE